MSSASEKNSLIIKNTIYMYGRMLVMLFVSLFTARIVFNTLGVDNYGTYNVVGGIIVFFTFLNNGLSSATKRFITAEIGRGDAEKIKHVFSICLIAHIIIAAIILFLAETVGLWFVNHKLNIPPNLMHGANWAYQLSVITAVLGIMQSPFGAVVVAYEKMNIFAIFTITDVLFKLGIIYLVQVLPGDKLVVYSSLLFVVGIINMIMYRVYTFMKIPTCRIKFAKDPKLLKEVFSFTSWSLMGQAAVVGTNQGVNVLINIFYSVAVNAAMGVSSTITGTVNGFVSNFQAAFHPQIIKSYNNGDYNYLQSLVVRSSKLSSYLIIVFLVPLLFEAPRVLELWLGDYPQYAVEFCVLTLFCIYLEAIAAPLWMVVYSQPNIKRYQLIIAPIYSLNFFIGWLVLYLGAMPYSVIIVRVAVFGVLMFARLIYAKVVFSQFNVGEWLYQVLVKSSLIIALSAIVVGVVDKMFELPIFTHIVVVTIISLVCTVPLIYLFGMSSSEQNFVKDIVCKKILRIKK